MREAAIVSTARTGIGKAARGGPVRDLVISTSSGCEPQHFDLPSIS